MINSVSRTGQAFWLGIGNLVSFSFGIVSAAILSRLLSVEEYGTYRQVLYVYNTLLVVFTLGLPRAYSFFLARMPIEQGRKSVDKINYIFLILGAIFSIVLLFGSNVIGSILKNPALPICIQYFSLTPIFLLPVLGIESVLATYKKTLYSTVYIILSRLFNLLCVVLPVVILKGGANTAVVGFTISSAICCTIGLFIERKPFIGIKSEKSHLSIKEVLKYSFPLLLASLWAIVINSAPQFFISRWYGTEAFAEFANGFIELPFAGMVISAVATVLLPEISRLAKDEANVNQVVTVWKSSFEKSAKIIYPIAIFACVFAPQIIECLYGNKYTGATIYFQIIVIINLLRVVPYAPIMLGLNMGRQYAIANIIPAFCVVLFDMIWVTLFYDAIGIAILQCLTIFICISIMCIFLSRRIGVSVKDLIPIKFAIKIIILSLVSSLIAYIISNLSSGNYIVILLIGCVLFIMILLPLSMSLNISYSDLIKPLLKKKRSNGR